MTISDSSCPFCDSKAMPERTIAESPRARVILSNPRLMPGHLLVIPKRHIEEPWELATLEVQEIFTLISEFGRKIVEHLSTGFDVRQNYRPFIKQGRVKIDHVHFHLLPRTLEDELYKVSMQYETGLFEDLSAEEEVQITELLQ